MNQYNIIMSTCTICYEKFRYKTDIIACCRCQCLLHRHCYDEWRRVNNNEIKPCIHCQQYGTSYTDWYDGYYYQQRFKQFTSNIYRKITSR